MFVPGIESKNQLTKVNMAVTHNYLSNYTVFKTEVQTINTRVYYCFLSYRMSCTETQSPTQKVTEA
jgi:hypothetical protein